MYEKSKPLLIPFKREDLGRPSVTRSDELDRAVTLKSGAIAGTKVTHLRIVSIQKR